jgi:hypothetical protein
VEVAGWVEDELGVVSDPLLIVDRTAEYARTIMRSATMVAKRQRTTRLVPFS